jgi:hypothetical protein
VTPFPLGLDSPGKRLTSTPQNRSPARLASIVAEHHFRGHARYTPRDVSGDGLADTFCNLFAQDICEAMSVVLPRNMRANDLVRWLSSAAEARELGWEPVEEHTAQRMADEGQLAVAAWYNRNGATGHIAVLVPSLGEAGTWCAQAGKSNFTRSTVASGFGAVPVSYFAHP